LSALHREADRFPPELVDGCYRLEYERERRTP